MPSRPAPPPPRRVPLAVWIVLAVATVHLIFFWVISDKHFLPKTRHIAPAPTPNFGARRTTSVDPQTGEVTTRSDFVVSTKLVSPVPKPTAPQNRDYHPDKP